MNQRIGLIDVDGGKFPNLALMKLSAYHKSQGNSVEWAMPMFGEYDRVYASKIFSFSPDFTDNYDCEIVRGGTGYSLTAVLPSEIDRLQPDYSIYPQVDKRTAYGFLTRGCPNKCKWCVVPIKEGATNILLAIIVVLLLARIVLQVRQGKRAFDKTYCAPSEVENCVKVVNRSQYHVREMIEKMAKDRWELVSAHLSKNGNETLFFTRKKIKNFLEE